MKQSLQDSTFEKIRRQKPKNEQWTKSSKKKFSKRKNKDHWSHVQ